MTILLGEFLTRYLSDTPVPPAHMHYHPSCQLSSFPGLSRSDFVFIRQDSHCRPLQVPYCGPFHFLSHYHKYFIIEMSNCPHLVSVDHLKPAKVPCNNPVVTHWG